MSTVLITGSNRGIGLFLCKQYKERGDKVIAVCRKSSPELEKLGVRIEQGVDLADKASIARLANVLADTPIDVLINNAGVLLRDGFPVDSENAHKSFDVNTLGPLRLTAALRKNLRKGSKLGMVSSRVGSVGDNSSGGAYSYRMSKAALNIASKSLAVELAPEGISVRILHPGYVKTDMTKQSGNAEPNEAARGLIARMDELDLDSTGKFFHANGEELPW